MEPVSDLLHPLASMIIHLFGYVVGRRPIYLVSFAIAIIGSICCAVSVNIAMLIVFRAVSAVGASSVCNGICIMWYFMLIHPLFLDVGDVTWCW